MENITNLKQLLSETAKKFGKKIAYKTLKKEISYNEFLEDVNSLGTKLIDLDLKGKNIAIMSENRYEWELAYFAIASGTGVVVPLDKYWPKKEVNRVIEKAEIEAVIYSKDYEDIFKDIKLKYKISMNLDKSNEQFLSERELIEDGKTLIKNGDRRFLDAEINNEELGFLYFTSGTTDESKAVMLSHKNVCSNLMSASKMTDLCSDDTVLSVLPLNHVLEGLFGFLNSIYKGAKRVYCYDVKDIVSCIRENNITFMCGVPAVYELMYKELIYNDEYKNINSNVNVFFSGGAPLNSRLKEEYKKIGINLVQGYGLTETAPVISLENKLNQRYNSVGKIIPKIETEIRNVDEEGVGTLWVKGDNVMMGYYKDCKESLENEWFNTGDLAKLDEDGFLFICGREKEMIVLENGKKIFPNEMEYIINEIDGVRESFVYENNGKLQAKIVHDKTYFKEDIQEYIKSEIRKLNEKLPEYKIIRNTFITDELINRNTNGKINRKYELEKIKNFDNNEFSETAEDVLLYDVEKKIRQIVGNQLEMKNFKNEDDLLLDLGADSLDKVEIILSIEKAWNINISKDDRKYIKTVNDLIKIIMKLPTNTENYSLNG